MRYMQSMPSFPQITYRFDGPHAEVVVVLLRELLATQLVHLRHLAGQVLAGLKALRIEDHLRYQGWGGGGGKWGK